MSETTIYMRHRNPGAAADLVIPVQLLVNVPDEVIEANVRANARRWPRPERIKTTPACAGVAVMCGSGPSLGDQLDTVRALQADGGLVFAMNGAAAYLDGRGIMPDFQVLVDARERTAELIGPARQHLIASQCDPVCFDAVPDARMWHFINGALDEQLPDDEPAHAQIGGGGSVGNCALVLAWAMGYRRFEVFGYDSSHRDGQSHAFHQPLNDFEPFGRFEFKGRTYLASYTMRSQAGRFQAVARALIHAGCALTVHGDGLLPDMWAETCRGLSSDSEDERERAKYELMWSVPEYSNVSPALDSLDTIIAALGHPQVGSLIDFGCGSGQATYRLAERGLDVLGVDFVRQGLATRIPFRDCVLWDLPADLAADYGICCDVMEHIPPQRVDAVIIGIMAAVPRCFFQISTVPDVFGAVVGTTLHLSVHPAEWWADHFEALGYAVKRLADNDTNVQLIVTRT